MRRRGRVTGFARALSLLVCALGLAACRTREAAQAEPAAWIDLVGPAGELSEAPREFGWEPVPGAARYKVTISDDDALWPLFVREIAAPPLSLSPEQAGAIVPGRIHLWKVEALDEGGRALAQGATRFIVRKR